MNKRKRSLKLILAVSFALVVEMAVGCGDLVKQPYPAKEYFGLEPATEGFRAERPPLPTTTSSTKHVLTVRAVKIAPPYDGLAFVYRDSATAYTSDYYANWVTKPSDLLKAGLERWLELSGPVRVVPAGSLAKADWVMELGITRLLIDRTDRSHPSAVVSAHMFLFRAVGSEQQLVSDELYEERAPANAQTPSAYAEAIAQAYKQVLTKLTVQLQKLTDGDVVAPKHLAAP